MANHITHLVTIRMDDPRSFIERHVINDREEQPRFDFESIVPMPQSVKDTFRDLLDPAQLCGDAQIEEYAKALLSSRRLYMRPRQAWIPTSVQRVGEFIDWQRKTNPNVDKWARRALLCAAETGHPGWYEWSCEAWGTKWNAYGYKQRSIDGPLLVIEFQTANGVPRPIFRKLAAMYPLARFDVESIDEGGWEFEASYVGGAELRFEEMPKSDDRYLRVYGHKRPVYDDDGEGLAATEGPDA